jgi:hypothetical protein
VATNSAEVTSFLLFAVLSGGLLIFRIASTSGTTIARPVHTGEPGDR